VFQRSISCFITLNYITMTALKQSGSSLDTMKQTELFKHFNCLTSHHASDQVVSAKDKKTGLDRKPPGGNQAFLMQFQRSF
jgi:hypothetical protein